ncbi:BPSS1780 family membrane protein [Rhodoferax sp.]|uniref:BPSS1780 family membrane protein n=1 Tax=Rhodoferax sp. TaxID=50421 RepID=UPI00262593DC|nr:BPSS1780 family membrane protein [Rhodoferax sp.]MDD3936304.1 BPSS1780 family membrane protein [Rhodoferax sp.]
MKLKLVPARTGASWVKQGMQTFFKQPLALAGLFFIFMAVMSVATMLPIVGLPLAMTLLPAATLGLMAATQEATQGKFPMPLILFTALCAGPAKVRAMLTLGGLYATGFMLAMGVSYLVDGGGFARLYLGGSAPTTELLQSPDFQTAMWVFIGLHLPLSLMFWHAPALVFWHDLPPLKSMFFSIVACFRNFWAFTVFGLSWMGAILVAVLAIGTLGNVMDNPGLSSMMLFPALMLLAAMFFTSLYFTYRDSFELEPPGQEQAAT